MTFPAIIYDSPNYTPSTSTYTCPVNGVYYVTVNIMKYSNDDLYLGVEHESHTVLSVADSDSGNIYNTVSNSALVDCAAGEEIRVRATRAGYVYGVNKRTTFTVMLIASKGIL